MPFRKIFIYLRVSEAYKTRFSDRIVSNLLMLILKRYFENYKEALYWKLSLNLKFVNLVLLDLLHQEVEAQATKMCYSRVWIKDTDPIL